VKILIAFLLITFNFLPIISPAFAQTPINPTPVDYDLPYPGILPDHPLYPLKELRDDLLYFFTSSPQKKAELNLLFADKKIGMFKSLLEKNKVELALDSVVESQSELLKAASLIPSLKQKNILPVGLPDKISLAAKKHLQEMNIMRQTANLNAGEKLNQALKLNNQASSIIDSNKE